MSFVRKEKYISFSYLQEIIKENNLDPKTVELSATVEYDWSPFGTSESSVIEITGKQLTNNDQNKK
jgi:hypothetical protein